MESAASTPLNPSSGFPQLAAISEARPKDIDLHIGEKAAGEIAIRAQSQATRGFKRGDRNKSSELGKRRTRLRIDFERAIHRARRIFARRKRCRPGDRIGP